MNKKKTIRRIVAILLAACYPIGLILMFFFPLKYGMYLWGIATFGGWGALYYIRRLEERENPPAEESPEEPETKE